MFLFVLLCLFFVVFSKTNRNSSRTLCTFHEKLKKGNPFSEALIFKFVDTASSAILARAVVTELLPYESSHFAFRIFLRRSKFCRTLSAI